MKLSHLFFLFLVLFSACRQNISTDQRPTASKEAPARVDTLSIPRPFMEDTAQALVLLPEGYDTSTQVYPVVYLLHGYSGDQGSWLRQMPGLKAWASLFGHIIVMPDGAYNSWYIDSPIKTNQKMATHIGLELPARIDQLYRTRQGKEGRAISGLSMGGHGAIYLAARFPEQFGAVSSMSGGLDLLPFSDKWELSEILGDPQAYAKNWQEYSVLTQLEAFEGRAMPILIDCGLDDFFFEVNQVAHQRLIDLEIPHDYVLRPGAHTWDYWRKIAPQHLLFFDQFFNQ